VVTECEAFVSDLKPKLDFKSDLFLELDWEYDLALSVDSECDFNSNFNNDLNCSFWKDLLSDIKLYN